MTTAIVILFVMALIVVAWIVVEIGQQNVSNYNDYENVYGQIKYLINNCDICDYYYYLIQKRLTELSKMKYKNDEKTDVLDKEFRYKFKTEQNELYQEPRYLVSEEGYIMPYSGRKEQDRFQVREDE